MAVSRSTVSEHASSHLWSNAGLPGLLHKSNTWQSQEPHPHTDENKEQSRTSLPHPSASTASDPHGLFLPPIPNSHNTQESSEYGFYCSAACFTLKPSMAPMTHRIRVHKSLQNLSPALPDSPTTHQPLHDSPLNSAKSSPPLRASSLLFLTNRSLLHLKAPPKYNSPVILALSRALN